MEKNCKWHFKPEGGADIGPNDPIHQMFKGNAYYSIVREAIQNSLDAIDNQEKPVVIEFKYFDIKRTEFPNLFEIENHIKSCNDYYNNNYNAKTLFSGMNEYLNGIEKGKKRVNIKCLKISDFNTRGMTLNINTDSPFYAFLRSSGVNAKTNQGSGGSFGFGKGAYFGLSPIKTLIVSTKDENKKYFFEGATRLTTHLDSKKNKLSAYGFYDNNNGNPTNELKDIPEIFQRKEIGTDINIIGLWDDEYRDKQMLRSVLNNYWLSILNGKLEVKINDKIIDKNNLENIIIDEFENEIENGSVSDIENWNPTPYFYAVKYKMSSDNFRYYSETLPTLKEVELFIYLKKGLNNRISYFRKPNMVVFKKTNKKINGYAGVFVCKSIEGDEILRLMENPAHNEWKKQNYVENGKSHKKAIDAEREINDFINRKLDELSRNNTSEKISIYGLEEYLAVPEELFEKDNNSSSGENEQDTGRHSNEITENETGSQTSSFNPVVISVSKQKPVEIKIDGNVTPGDGDETTMNGGENEGDGGDLDGTGDGNNGTKGKPDDNIDDNKILKDVTFKVAAQKENDLFYHNLILRTGEEIKESEIEILAIGDNDNAEKLKINYSDKGDFQNNVLKKVKLNKGINFIKVRFENNIKLNLKVRTYEIQ